MRLPGLSAISLSVGGASRLDLRVGAVRMRASQSPALGNAGQPLVDFLTWAEGAEGPVYIGQLCLGKVSETRGNGGEKAARSASFQDKSQRFCRHRLSPGAQRYIQAVSALPLSPPRVPPLHTLTQGHTLLQRRRQGVVPVKGTPGASLLPPRLARVAPQRSCLCGRQPLSARTECVPGGSS